MGGPGPEERSTVTAAGKAEQCLRALGQPSRSQERRHGTSRNAGDEGSEAGSREALPGSWALHENTILGEFPGGNERK